MEKIKIMHLLKSNSYSGAENVVCTIIKLFEDDSMYDMVYVCPDGPIKEFLIERNIPFLLLKKFDIVNIKRAVETIKPDIIHAHDFSASVMSAFVGENCKIISHIHNNPPWLKSLNFKTIIYMLCSFKFSYVLGVSSSILNEFYFKGVLEKKFIKINNIIDCDYIMRHSSPNQMESKNIDILFVGRMADQKDPLRAVKIIKKIIDIRKKSIKSVFIGSGYLFNNVQQYIKLNHLEENIELIGFEKNPYKYMEKAKILIMPSKYEGFGLVAVEAILMGSFVVASPVGGLVEIINTCNGALCSSDEQFVDTIVRKLNEINKGNNHEINHKVDSIKKFIDKNSYKASLVSIYEN